MTLQETYAKRKARSENVGHPAPLIYHRLPPEFREQVSRIWDRAIGRYYDPPRYGARRIPISNGFWYEIERGFSEENGSQSLGRSGDDPRSRCRSFLASAPVDDALSLIEYSFQYIEHKISRAPGFEIEYAGITRRSDAAIRELNSRFEQHGLGYEYADGRIVSVDSKYVHAEVVKPALALLHQAGFEEAVKEFLKAQDFYRQHEYEQAIVEAAKSFESTMKYICGKRGWTPKKEVASGLVACLVDNGLVPNSCILDTALPYIRNNMGGHGKGQKSFVVPPHLAAFAIHVAASNIVYVVEAHQAMP